MYRYAILERDETTLHPVAGVSISVLDSTGATKATLYDDAGNSLSNPLTSNALGEAYFNVETADAGTYMLRHVYNGQTIKVELVPVGVPSDEVFKGDKGDKGDDGNAATLAVHSTTTLAAGSPATVVNIGTSTAASLDFGIPQGPKGDQGDGVADLLTRTVHYFDGAPNPSGGSATAASGTGINDDVTTYDRPTSRITIRAAAAGTVTIKPRWTKSGNVFAPVGGVTDFTLTVPAAGTYTFNAPADFTAYTLLAGERRGQYSANVSMYKGTTPTDGPATWFVGGNSTGFTTSSPANTGIAMQITYEGDREQVVDAAAELDTLSSASRKIERMPWQINFISGDGQSNMQGASGSSVSSAQEYDNLTLPAHSASTTASLLPMTAVNTEYGGTGNQETPIIGACGFLKERLLSENQLSYTQMLWQLVGINNGWTSQTIASLSKGGVSGAYSAWLTQLTAIGTYASLNSLAWGYLASLWAQGEADGSLTQAQYLAALLQYELDKRTDAKAASGQTIDPILATWQLSSCNRQVALAQRQAARQRKSIICVGPAYPLTYVDVFHANATSAKVLGGYFGKALKQTIVDGIKFEPLDVIGFSVVGNTAYFTMNRNGLVIDTAGIVPDQSVSPNNKYGFSAVNGSAVAQTVSSVTVSGNIVAVTYGAAPSSGWVLSYANGFKTGSYPWTAGGGAAGNLRDRAGDLVTYQGVPMHNWSLAWDVTL